MAGFSRLLPLLLASFAMLPLLQCGDDIHTPSSSAKNLVSRGIAADSHVNAHRIAAQKLLSSADVALLIQDFGREPQNRIAVPMGSWLLTGHTPETRILVAHPDESYRQLVVALDHPDMDVRRYAAFCIGEIGARDSISLLQRALRKEITFSVSERSKQLDWPQAGVDAMVRAYGHIDRRDLVRWFLETTFSEAEVPVANQKLAWLLPSGPDCRALSPSRCHEQWKLYWQRNERRADKELFHH